MLEWYNSFFPQVTCEYYFDGGAAVPVRVHTVVVSVQHSEKVRKHFISYKKVLKTFFFFSGEPGSPPRWHHGEGGQVRHPRQVSRRPGEGGLKRSIFLIEKFAKWELKIFSDIKTPRLIQQKNYRIV